MSDTNHQSVSYRTYGWSARCVVYVISTNVTATTVIADISIWPQSMCIARCFWYMSSIRTISNRYRSGTKAHMKKLHSRMNSFSQSVQQKLLNRKTELSLVSMAVLLSACGGGGSDNGTTNPNQATISPILQVGMQRQYIGASTRSVAYTTPTTSNINNTLSYTFTENQSVLQAPANAPGNFDVNSIYAYSVTQDPGVGNVPISQTVDDYRNLVLSGTNQYTVDYGQNSTTIANDETANALGGGPYSQTTVTSQIYTTPRASLTYPLASGAVNTIPQSYTQSINFTDVNASSAAPPNGSNYGYTRNRTQNNDGSFSYLQTGVTGVDATYTMNSDGSGSSVISNSNTSTTTTNTISVPVLNNNIYTIPVNVAIASASPSNTNYPAFDWYPGNTPAAPLILETQTVVGPTATLPTACVGALVQPNMVEVDTSTTSMNTVNASYAVTTTQSFNSNGVSVCTLNQETSTSYSLQTGAVFATTTTQTTTILNAIN